jgi:hypothetical protein
MSSVTKLLLPTRFWSLENWIDKYHRSCDDYYGDGGDENYDDDYVKYDREAMERDEKTAKMQVEYVLDLIQDYVDKETSKTIFSYIIEDSDLWIS